MAIENLTFSISLLAVYRPPSLSPLSFRRAAALRRRMTVARVSLSARKTNGKYAPIMTAARVSCLPCVAGLGRLTQLDPLNPAPFEARICFHPSHHDWAETRAKHGEEREYRHGKTPILGHVDVGDGTAHERCAD